MDIRVFPCVLSACLAAGASAQVFELEAQNEATILDVPTQAIGDGALFSGTSNNRLTKRAMIRFDLSVLPAGDIVSATLELTPRAIRGPVPISAHRITRDWNEGPAPGQGMGGGLGSLAGPDDVTWLVDGFGANWNSAGGDFDPVATDSATFTLLLTPGGFDVTQDVIDMIDGAVLELRLDPDLGYRANVWAGCVLRNRRDARSEPEAHRRGDTELPSPMSTVTAR